MKAPDLLLPRQTARWVLVVALGLASLRLCAADSVPLREIVAKTKAVAHVRVTRITEELQDDKVRHVVTFALCGRNSGLGELKELEVHFTPPPKPETEEPAAPATEPIFDVGHRCVVLLTSRDTRWESLFRLKITEDGQFVEEGIGEDIGLKPNAEADAVVQLIAAKIVPPGQLKKDRPKPPPTARNQPWNLMRASPLRRVWPFFPR